MKTRLMQAMIGVLCTLAVDTYANSWALDNRKPGSIVEDVQFQFTVKAKWTTQGAPAGNGYSYYNIYQSTMKKNTSHAVVPYGERKGWAWSVDRGHWWCVKKFVGDGNPWCGNNRCCTGAQQLTSDEPFASSITVIWKPSPNDACSRNPEGRCSTTVKGEWSCDIDWDIILQEDGSVILRQHLF